MSSDECLTYALQNRAEWEERGEQLLNEMIEAIEYQEIVVIEEEPISEYEEEPAFESGGAAKTATSSLLIKESSEPELNIELKSVGSEQVVIVEPTNFESKQFEI